MKYLIFSITFILPAFGKCFPLQNILLELQDAQNSVEYEIESVSSYSYFEKESINLPLLLENNSDIDKFTLEQRHLTHSHSAQQSLALESLLPKAALELNCFNNSPLIKVLKHSSSELILVETFDQLDSQSSENMSNEKRYAIKLKRNRDSAVLEIMTINENTPYLYYYLNAKREDIDANQLDQLGFRNFQVIKERIIWKKSASP